MHGEKVVIKQRIQDGTDDLNNPIWRYSDIDVENVLVAPGASQDAIDSTRPDGVTVKYTLYFPKTFSGRLEHSKIVVRDETLDVVGSPRHFDSVNCPTEWWMVVEIGAANG